MMRRLTRALVALAILLLLVAGVPVLLLRFGTWPIHEMPRLQGVREAPNQALTDTAMVGILTVAAWAAWGAFALSVLLELASQARGASRPNLPVRLPFQGGAQRLVASLLMSVTLSGPLAHLPAGAMPSLPSFESGPVRAPVTLVVEPPRAAGPSASETPQPSAADLPRVAVAPGDNPWCLAERHLGDGLRWREIWDLNRGLPQDDGRTWVVEDQIEAGWQLRFPADATNLPSSRVSGADDREPTADRGPGEYVVRAGDTLSEIAKAELGAAGRYGEIVEANRDVEQPDGAHLTNPDVIRPGWRLVLSAAPAAPPAPPTPQPTRTRAGPATPSIATDSGAAPTGQTGSTDAPASSGDPSPSTAPAIEPVSPVDGPAVHPQRPGMDRPSETPADPGADEAESDLLPALAPPVAGITGATVLATGLALALRRRRQRQAATGARRGRSQRRHQRPNEVERAIVRASDLPLVRWAAQALATMASVLDPRHLDGVPTAVELSENTGLEVLWDKAQPAAPDPWRATDGGWAWRLPFDPDAPVPPDDLPSPLPALVTMGQRDGRQLLVNLEALGSLALDGDPVRVDSFVRSIVTELATSEELADAFVTLTDIDLDDTHGLDRVQRLDRDEAIKLHEGTHRSVSDGLGSAATTFARRSGRRGCHVEATVLVIRELDEAATDELIGASPANRGVAALIVGDVKGASARLTIDADGLGHLEPLGLTFQAVGLQTGTATEIELLLKVANVPDEAADEANDAAPASPNGSAPLPTDGQDPKETPVPLADLEWPPARPLQAINGDGGANEPEGALPFEPALELVRCAPEPRADLLVKVLGTPRIPDRPGLSRRELILAVYLACHPGPATASGVQDGIWNGRAVQTKTLWNLITKTRRGLGCLDDGTLLLSQADRVGNTLNVSPRVTTDVEILRTAYERALDSSSTEAIPVLSEALDLIEGPPFDASGYDWAHHTHQYVADASALIEQATEHLVELALAAGDIDLARHALVQGLRGLPGNEVLYRLRMKVEHEAGNLPGVEAAWSELLALLADLEAEPSAATSALHGALTG